MAILISDYLFNERFIQNGGQNTGRAKNNEPNLFNPLQYGVPLTDKFLLSCYEIQDLYRVDLNDKSLFRNSETKPSMFIQRNGDTLLHVFYYKYGCISRNTEGKTQFLFNRNRSEILINGVNISGRFQREMRNLN